MSFAIRRVDLTRAPVAPRLADAATILAARSDMASRVVEGGRNGAARIRGSACSSLLPTSACSLHGKGSANPGPVGRTVGAVIRHERMCQLEKA